MIPGHRKFLYLLIISFAVTAFARSASAATHYIITNDDVSGQLLINSTSFYSVSANGGLNLTNSVSTNGTGIGGGYFGASRVTVVHTGSQDCAFISNAASGSIAGIVLATQTLSNAFTGSPGDQGTSNGIGLASNHHYLYASFSDSDTIGTFKIKSGCTLKFIGDVTVGGLNGGIINGMAVHDDMMVTTYGDGSIESFNIAGGVPVSDGDLQNSTGYDGATYPNGVDITSDGRFAIFGDTATSTVLEVSDISSGKLAPTVVYRLGRGISSSNVMLSPDESLLYISNTQGDRVSAAFFDAASGVLTKGCSSNRLRGYVDNFSYLGALALQKASGTGGVLYVAEFGSSSAVATIKVNSSDGQCTMKEMAHSPAFDPNSPGLLSIAAFPPRKF